MKQSIRLRASALDNNYAMQKSNNSDTAQRLKKFGEELFRWRRTTNLLSKPAFDDIWTRHIQDSLQILRLAPNAKRWLDIGSGAGFPGLVIAIQLYGVANAEVHCVESDKRKCAFLAHVVRATEIPAIIHPLRIEDVATESLLPIDAVTARAVTSLPKLLPMCKTYLDSGADGVFPQGRNYKDAAAFLKAHDLYDYDLVQSETDPESRIIRLRNAMV